MSDHTKYEIVKAFKEFDQNEDKKLSKEECLKYWETNFPLLNSDKMISQVDKDGDGEVSYNEWSEFWEYLYNLGYSEEMIVSEV